MDNVMPESDSTRDRGDDESILETNGPRDKPQ